MKTIEISKKIYFPLTVILLWGPILFFDATYFVEHYFNGKWITNTLVILLSIYLFTRINFRIKVLMLIMIPLSWFGEYIFSEVMGMYHYREGGIPLYVPVGHAGVFTIGYLISGCLKYRNEEKIKKYFALLYSISFLFVAFYFKDTYSLILGVLFLLALKRKKFLPFYMIMGVIVIYLELIGTFLGNWKWEYQQGIFTTVNPPIGVVFFYVGGDLMLGKVTRFLLRKRKQFKRTMLA